MIQQHKNLTQERWNELSFCEQMANVGSEVSRALNWKKKGNQEYCQKAFHRSLELLSLTVNSINTASRYKELARLREALVDYFYGSNDFISTELSWRRYFDAFNFAARKNF